MAFREDLPQELVTAGQALIDPALRYSPGIKRADAEVGLARAEIKLGVCKHIPMCYCVLGVRSVTVSLLGRVRTVVFSSVCIAN